MFATDDELAAALSAAGEATGEKLWRLPLGPEYDKLIDSKFADMKNTGGRYAGSITGAQFIKRFVKDTPWVHLDIAGTGMGSPQTDINRSWASGFGCSTGWWRTSTRAELYSPHPGGMSRWRAL